jgi:MoaA/NifB/PqqE/SkfB family radical SAM enzyme
MSWFSVEDIGRVQIELTNYCNAACPQCDRYEQIQEWKDPDLNNSHFTLEQIKNIFSPYDWKSLDIIHYCGNVDEPTVNPEMLDITDYLIHNTNKPVIHVATNGGTRDIEFWTELGILSKHFGVKVTFGLDGLHDTNHIYRRNVRWDKVEKNYNAYIKAGGYAIWQFIVFDHNVHQLQAAKDLADKEGFKEFQIIQSGRANVMNPTKENDVKKQEIDVPDWYDYNPLTIDGVDIKEVKLDCVRCPAKLNSKMTGFHQTKGNIYISAKGYVTPCCWMGNPRELIKLWKTKNIDKKGHNVLNNHLQNILDGEWYSHIDNQMQEYDLCVSKCKEINGDKHL